MTYDNPFTPRGAEIANMAWREQLKTGFKDMGLRSWSSAKNFGYIGGVYAATECAIEGLRAKNDLMNHTASGCITGAWLGRNAGPQAALVGCVGFSAFSTAIEAYMRMPES
jgi:mitochondrial import inner membrane translocase subunit TIM22